MEGEPNRRRNEKDRKMSTEGKKRKFLSNSHQMMQRSSPPWMYAQNCIQNFKVEVKQQKGGEYKSEHIERKLNAM